MKKQQKGWLQFIIDNFEPGTTKEICEHIRIQARLQGYGDDNNTIDATVRRILPEYTPGRFKPTSKRKLHGNVFFYENETKRYYLAADLLYQLKRPKTELKLESKAFRPRDHSEEVINIETAKDKSKTHEEIVKTVHEYAMAQGYITNPGQDNIDLLLEKKENDQSKFIINEIKSYSGSIYTAVGQVQWYKYDLLQKYSNITIDNIAMLNIIGNFKLNPKYKGFLKELKINYVNIDEIKNIF